MKSTFTFILVALFLLIGFGVHESGAIVALGDLRQQQNNEVVTGVYEGYKNQTVHMLLRDGTRKSFPFKLSDPLLKRISKTRLFTQVTITVENGSIVSFEEVHK
jgi:hypothetical protein